MSNLPSPSQQLEDMLKQTGAVLLRGKNNKVYGLPNGKIFTKSHTPSDSRFADIKALNELKRRAGVRVAKPPAVEAQLVEEPALQDALTPFLGIVESPQPVPASPVLSQENPTPSHAEPAKPAKPGSLRERIEALIAQGVAEQTELIEQASTIERHVNMLRGLAAHADDSMTEALLALLIPHAAAAQPEPPSEPPPPPAKAAPYVEVTKKIIHEILECSPATFTVGDIFDMLTRGMENVEDQRKRIIGSVTSILHAERAAGYVELRKQGRGPGSMSEWRKIDPTLVGRRIEVYPHEQQPEPELVEA